MSKVLISVFHPTARLEGDFTWRRSHDAFLAMCSDPKQVEYVLVAHESRYEKAREQVQAMRETLNEWGNFKLVCNTLRDCNVDQVNAGAMFSSAPLLFGNQDDLVPPENWDRRILESFNGFEREQVACFSSGSPTDRSLFVVGAITRNRFERMGYVLHPDFESMYADNYYTFQVRQDEAAGLCTVTERFDVEFEHRHPIFGKGVMDPVYQAQNARECYERGLLTLQKLQSGKKILAVCLPGEWFQFQWVAAWTNFFGHMLDRFIVIPIFGYSSNVHCTRIEQAEKVLSVKPAVDLVLWIDDDNVVNPQDMDSLVKDLEQDPSLSCVVGWCWCDQNPDEPGPFVMSCGMQDENMVRLPFSLESVKEANGPVIPIQWSGFPCVLMRRSMLETLGARAFVPIIKDDANYGFASEDAAFFWRARQAGLKTAVDFRVKVPHVKWRQIEPDLGVRFQNVPGIETQYRDAGLKPELVEA